MDTMWVLVIIVVLVFLGLAGILLALSRKPADPPKDKLAAKDSKSKAASKPEGRMFGTVIVPLIFWVVFWGIVYVYFHGAWAFMMRELLLFLIINVIYVILVYRGYNMVNLLGKPEELWHPSLLMFVIGCMIVFVLLEKACTPASPAHASRVAVVQQEPPPRVAVPVAKEKVPAPTPEAQPSGPLIDVVITVYPRTIEEEHVIVPQGYEVVQPDKWQENAVLLSQAELRDLTTKAVFVAKGSDPVEITIRLTPKKCLNCN